MTRTTLLLTLLAVLAASARAGDLEPLPVAAFEKCVDRTLYLDAERLELDVRDGIARVHVRQTFRNRSASRPPGAECFFTWSISPLAAFWRYRITEEGQWWEGELQERAKARAEYDRIVRRRRDPGLLEWLQPGDFRSSLYPVPGQGGTKDVELFYDEAMRLTTQGDLVLRYPLEAFSIGELTVTLRAQDSRGIESLVASPALVLQTAAPKGVWTGATRLQRLRPKAPLELRIRLARAGHASAAARPLVSADGGLLVPLPVSPSDLDGKSVTGGFLVGRLKDPARRDRVVVGRFAQQSAGPERGQTVPVEVDIGSALELPAELTPSLARLLALARGQTTAALPPDPEAARLATAESLRAQVVGPFASFLARPVAPLQTQTVPRPVQEVSPPVESASRAPGGWPVVGGPAKGAALAPPRPAPGPPALAPQAGPSLPSAPALFFGNFRAARERANDRACYANQKTLAGAIEMFELDTNERVTGPEGLTDRNRQSGLFTPAPVPGLELVAAHRWPTGGAGKLWLSALPERLWERLVGEGYLQSRFDCPGAGRDTYTNYVLLQPAGEVLCLRHGRINAPGGGSARQQLANAGVTEPDWLACADPTDYRAAKRQAERLQTVSVLAVYAVFALLIGGGLWLLTSGKASWPKVLAASAGSVLLEILFLAVFRRGLGELAGTLLVAFGLVLAMTLGLYAPYRGLALGRLEVSVHHQVTKGTNWAPRLVSMSCSHLRASLVRFVSSW